MNVNDCQEVFAVLSEYLDKELPNDICREIDSHIAGCPPCVEFVESLKKSIDLCRSSKQMDTPGPLPEGARGRLYEAYLKALSARREQASGNGA